MRVKIKETDERLGVKAGEVYEAKRYWLDPNCKISLLGRIPDGYDPCCNQYIHNVEFLQSAKAQTIEFSDGSD